MKNLKKQVGIEAAKYVKTGMIVGLGTGSTAKFFVEEVGRRVREEGLRITAVTTSSATSRQAQLLDIPLKNLDEVDQVDLLVDGADEIDPQLNGIKGGGAALLMEKIVASYAKDYIWIVDESKLSDALGSFKLPVEVVPYGAENLYRKFEKMGYQPSWRLDKAGERLITDMKHYIIDLHIPKITHPELLALELDQTVGVVEHGLFCNIVKHVIVAGAQGIKTLDKLS